MPYVLSRPGRGEYTAPATMCLRLNVLSLNATVGEYRSPFENHATLPELARENKTFLFKTYKEFPSLKQTFRMPPSRTAQQANWFDSCRFAVFGHV